MSEGTAVVSANGQAVEEIPVIDDGALLTRGEVLNADDVRYELVDAHEWKPGGKLRVRNFTSSERDAWEKSMAKEVPVPGGKGKTKWITDAENIRAKAVARCAVDAQGNRIFQDADIIKLGTKSAAPMERAFAAIQRLSGISQNDMEEMEGNSEPDRSGSSSAS